MDFDAASFFDPSKARPRKQAGDVDTRANKPGSVPEALSVTQLVSQIKDALKTAFPHRLTVIAEVSKCTYADSGHVYFDIKDSQASFPAVAWRSVASKLKFRLEKGMEVILAGRVDLFERSGRAQFIAEKITPSGAGELEIALKQLRDKLAAEGLFDAERKQALPRFPRAVGVVTSPTGAAIRDIARTLKRRWPACPVYVVGARVQGDQAAGEVAAAITSLDRHAEQFNIDVILVSRGGGSLEDLWAFNEEPVVRAIAAARTPIISGVGHEIDTTLADLAADIRAATPTAAAELAVPDQMDLYQRVNSLARRLDNHVQAKYTSGRQGLSQLARSWALRQPKRLIESPSQQLDELAQRLTWSLKRRLHDQREVLTDLTGRLATLEPRRRQLQQARTVDSLAHRLRWALGTMSKRKHDTLTAALRHLESVHPKHRLAMATQHLSALARQLDALSYKATLQRGFSVTRGEDGAIVRSVQSVRSGDRLETQLADGTVTSLVGGRRPTPKTPRKKPQAPSPEGPSLFDALDTPGPEES
jgi:exodeoxyribonuclease VII large subunit